MTGTRPLMSAAMTVRIAPAEFGIITPMKPGSYAFELAREDQGAQERRLVSDTLAGGAIDDGEPVAVLPGDADEGFAEGHEGPD